MGSPDLLLETCPIVSRLSPKTALLEVRLKPCYHDEHDLRRAPMAQCSGGRPRERYARELEGLDDPYMRERVVRGEGSTLDTLLDHPTLRMASPRGPCEHILRIWLWRMILPTVRVVKTRIPMVAAVLCAGSIWVTSLGKQYE
jgi:hypothetical protein